MCFAFLFAVLLQLPYGYIPDECLGTFFSVPFYFVGCLYSFSFTVADEWVRLYTALFQRHFQSLWWQSHVVFFCLTRLLASACTEAWALLVLMDSCLVTETPECFGVGSAQAEQGEATGATDASCISPLGAVSYTHLTLPTNREV